MAEELEQVSAPEGAGEPQATPEADAVQAVPMVPETDLRKLQAAKDREVAEARRQADAAQQQLAAMRQSMESDVTEIARATMDPAAAQTFLDGRRQQQQAADAQRQLYEAQKLSTIVELSEQYSIPVSEFASVRQNPYAQPGDAYRVVNDYLEKKAREIEAAATQKQKEAEVLAQKAERQERRVSGADRIGAPPEPAKGSPDLEVQYKAEVAAIVAASANPRSGVDYAARLRGVREKYRKLGHQID